MNQTLSKKSNQHYDVKALSSAIDPNWIAHALAATGKASIRRRKLPAEQVVWLVIALAVNPSRRSPLTWIWSCLMRVNPDIAKSALTQSRQRLGDEPLAQLFAISAAAWDQRHQRGQNWRGLARYAVDGSTPPTPDRPENRSSFGAQSYASGVVAKLLPGTTDSHADGIGQPSGAGCRLWRVRKKRNALCPKAA